MPYNQTNPYAPYWVVRYPNHGRGYTNDKTTIAAAKKWGKDFEITLGSPINTNVRARDGGAVFVASPWTTEPKWTTSGRKYYVLSAIERSFADATS